jgi:hypothetical protein
MAFVLIAEIGRRRGHIRIPAWVAALGVLALTYLALSLISTEPLPGLILSFRDHVGYAVIGLYAYQMIDSANQRERLATRAIGMAAVVSLFGVAQVTLSDQLPSRLLSPDSSTLFGFYGSDVVRANGLAANTIVYGALLSLFFCLSLARLASSWSWRRIAPTLAIAAGILATFSRMAILSLLVCSVVILIWSIHQRGRTMLLTSLIAGTTISAVTVWAVWPSISTSVEESFLVGGLFRGENPTVKQSNEGHTADIAIAVDILRTHPLGGVGIGTNADGSVYSENNEWITDGAIWARLAEGGLLLAGTYALLIGSLVVSSHRATALNRAFWMPQGLAVFAVFQFLIASFVNSAIFGKATFVMFWMVVGLALREDETACAETGGVSRLGL